MRCYINVVYQPRHDRSEHWEPVQAEIQALGLSNLVKSQTGDDVELPYGAFQGWIDGINPSEAARQIANDWTR